MSAVVATGGDSPFVSCDKPEAFFVHGWGDDAASGIVVLPRGPVVPPVPGPLCVTTFWSPRCSCGRVKLGRL